MPSQDTPAGDIQNSARHPEAGQPPGGRKARRIFHCITAISVYSYRD
jgi:hypothetical protein